MTTVCRIHKTIPIVRASVRMIQFSGSCKLDGVGVIRQVIGWKYGNFDKPTETYSDENGDWDFVMPGSIKDTFLVVAIGEDDEENSEIFSGLHG